MTQTFETFATLDTLTARDLIGEGWETVDADASLREVVDRFLTGPSRHLVVAGVDGSCAGMIDPRHIAQARRFDPRRDAEIQVRDLGCAPWIALSPDDDLRTCARMLVEHDLDAIPVLDAQRHVLGIVTDRAVTRALADASAHVHPRWQE